jgi:hypothetical protein
LPRLLRADLEAFSLDFDLEDFEDVDPPPLPDFELFSDFDARSDFDDFEDFSEREDVLVSAAWATAPGRFGTPTLIGAIREKAAAAIAMRPKNRMTKPHCPNLNMAAARPNQAGRE